MTSNDEILPYLCPIEFRTIALDLGNILIDRRCDGSVAPIFFAPHNYTPAHESLLNSAVIVSATFVFMVVHVLHMLGLP